MKAYCKPYTLGWVVPNQHFAESSQGKIRRFGF
jgi:hypothetical protein